jgi:hypothetical protein
MLLFLFGIWIGGIITTLADGFIEDEEGDEMPPDTFTLCLLVLAAVGWPLRVVYDMIAQMVDDGPN